MRFLEKKPTKISVKEARILSMLTIREGIGSYLKESFLEIRRTKKDTNSHVIIAYEGKLIVGWALIQKEGRRWEFQVNVRKAYRRKGIGTKIFNKAIKYSKNIKTYPHDEVSTKFFNKIRKEKIII